MTGQVVGWVPPLIAILVIGGFVILYGGAIVTEWRGTTKTQKAQHPAEYTYVATLLSGLVAGVVAMTFNEQLPKVPSKTAPAVTAAPTTTLKPEADKTDDATKLVIGDEIGHQWHWAKQGEPKLVSEYSPAAGGTAIVNLVNAVKKLFSPDLLTKANITTAITAAYIIFYLVIGVASIATWVRRGADTSDLLRNMALISIGLFLSIARTFFALPT